MTTCASGRKAEEGAGRHKFCISADVFIAHSFCRVAPPALKRSVFPLKPISGRRVVECAGVPPHKGEIAAMMLSVALRAGLPQH
jgi:hypothetical protein